MDHQLLSHITHAYESTCLKVKTSENEQLPRIVHTTVHRFVEEYASIYLSSIEYLMRIPHCHALIVSNKLSLLPNQMSILMHINVAIVYPDMSINLLLSLRNLFGHELADDIIQSIERIQGYSHDFLLLKLFLIIISLSTGYCQVRSKITMNFTCSDASSLLNAQNVYVELLWKYILSRSLTEFDAIQIWTRLIPMLLYIQNVHGLIDDYMSSLPDEIEHIEPMLLQMWPNYQYKSNSL
jgi:hypothetical protein